MKKIQLLTLKDKIEKLISRGENDLVSADVYRLKDGSIFKVFNSAFLKMLSGTLPSYDLESKVLEADNLTGVPEIVKPIKAVYDGPLFTGYIVPFVKGIDYVKYDEQRTLEQRTDLLEYAKMHYNLEQIVKRANAKRIVFPDLCTCTNIILNNGKILLIDYDGLQIKKHATASFSSALGNQEDYNIPKYIGAEETLYTDNLDKKSLITLYMSTALNVDLCTIGSYNEYTGRMITLDDVVQVIGLDDEEISHKIWKVLQPTGDNEFLGEDVFKMAEKYEMRIIGQNPDMPNRYLKKLKRK